MGCAGSRLEQGGINIRQVLDGEHSLSWIGTVLGKATVHGDTVGLEILTEELLPATAVEAFSAELRVVSNYSIANLEALDIRPNGSNDTDGFVTRDQWELGQKFTLVDVEVGPANAAGLDFEL